MRIDKVAILHYEDTDTLKEEHVEGIKQALPGVEVIVARSSYAEGAKPLLDKTTDADVLLTWGFATRGLEEFCKGAPGLKWIHCFTSGVDGILRSEIGNLDIKITCTKGIQGFAIADHVLAFIFAFLREIPLCMDLKLKKVRIRDPKIFKYDEISYKTVGIIGLGYVGKEIARKCKLLSMRVVAADIIPDQSGLVDRFYPMSEVDRLLEESDFVVLALPLTQETRDFIGERELRMMKKQAYLINIARGEVVNTPALIKALQENQITGAGLDVIAGEDNLLPDNPMWDLSNVIYTPHIAAMSPHYMERAIRVSIDNLLRFSRDEDLLFLVR